MNEILFYPTMRCNLRCDFCPFKVSDNGYFFHAHGCDHSVGGELAWHDWLRCFNRFRPYFLEITGGEPLMYPGFADLLAHLPSDSRWAITSNTLLDVEKLSLRGCESWTASWHGVNEKAFRHNLTVLNGRGVTPSVSWVVRPDEIAETRAVLENFGRLARVNLLRELNPGVDWAVENADAWQELKTLAAEFNANLLEKQIPPTFDFPSFDFCDSGSAYFCAMPDGQVYRCYADAMCRPEKVLGHISNFKTIPPGQPCGNACAGCGADDRQRKWNQESA